jgi:hypothetical protein
MAEEAEQKAQEERLVEKIAEILEAEHEMQRRDEEKRRVEKETEERLAEERKALEDKLAGERRKA